jgi:hypothetical protein
VGEFVCFLSGGGFLKKGFFKKGKREKEEVVDDRPAGA